MQWILETWADVVAVIRNSLVWFLLAVLALVVYSATTLTLEYAESILITSPAILIPKPSPSPSCCPIPTALSLFDGTSYYVSANMVVVSLIDGNYHFIAVRCVQDDEHLWLPLMSHCSARLWWANPVGEQCFLADLPAPSSSTLSGLLNIQVFDLLLPLFGALPTPMIRVFV